jgi:hypothetical protein
MASVVSMIMTVHSFRRWPLTLEEEHPWSRRDNEGGYYNTHDSGMLLEDTSERQCRLCGTLRYVNDCDVDWTG